MASSLRGVGTPLAVVQELALKAAHRCRPPLPAHEALGIVDSVFARYRPNRTRPRGLSQERIDVLAALATAANPLSPSQVATLLGRDRDAVKQLMNRMFQDGQVDRDGGRYRLGDWIKSPRLSLRSQPSARAYQDEAAAAQANNERTLHRLERRTGARRPA